MILTVSVPARWVEAIYQSHACLVAEERTAFLRWKLDLHRNFGPVRPVGVDHSRTFDRCHEGTEYGCPPAMCKNVELAFDEEDV